MDGSPSDLLGKVRGLVSARAILDDALVQAIEECRDAGVDSVVLAGALGVHRSTLYRKYLPPKRDGEAAP